MSKSLTLGPSPKHGSNEAYVKHVKHDRSKQGCSCCQPPFLEPWCCSFPFFYVVLDIIGKAPRWKCRVGFIEV